MAKATKQQLKRRKQIIGWTVIVAAILLLAGIYLRSVTIPVLQPAGPIAAGERRLLIIACLLMLVIVLPVFGLTFGFAWRYRESKKAKYTPNWDHSRLAETIWWLIPSVLILTLSVLTWRGTYQYDPYKPIASHTKAIDIQVVALDWRWLFIYPGQHMASIDEVHFPVNTPVTFHITADAPMNSFWIPQLAGQIYAMPGMNSELNVMATRTGTFIGRSANISGVGFAGMQITAKSESPSDFAAWNKRAMAMPQLTGYAYDTLAEKSTDTNHYQYSRPMTGLYQYVVNKYMGGKSTIAEAINYDSTKDLESL